MIKITRRDIISIYDAALSSSLRVNYQDLGFRPLEDDRAIRNLKYLIEYNLQHNSADTGLASSAVCIASAAFLPPENMKHDAEYESDFSDMSSLYRRILGPERDSGAVEQLKIYAKKYATISALRNKKRLGPEKIKLINFVINKDPIYNFFDHPELRQELISTYKEIIGIDEAKNIIYKLPNDPESDEFFDVLRGVVDEFIEVDSIC